MYSQQGTGASFSSAPDSICHGKAPHGVFGAGVEKTSVVSYHGESTVPLPVRIGKVLLWAASWTVTVWWFTLWFRMPSTEGRAFRKTVQDELNYSTFWSKAATNYTMYAAPVIALAIFALLFLELEERYPERRCPSAKQPMLVRLYRAIWTQPILVKTPIGVVTIIDIVIIGMVLVCTCWIWGRLTVRQFAAIDAAKPKKGVPKWALKWDKLSDTLGKALPFTIGCLFMPVARGSPILRLIDVPFEQAVKYHRWMGYLTVLLVVVHGATYGVYAGAIHKIELLIEWPYYGTSNLAGTISCVAAMIMGATSIPYFRSRHFNTFFSMHQLYIVFFAFYVFHVDFSEVGGAFGPIFLFFIDRFLRMVQSRRQVRGVSARILPSGLVELKIPKQTGFKYNTLSFLYINFPGLSRLQWHPFSTASSPLNDDNNVSVIIKPLGDWTNALYSSVAAKDANDVKVKGCPFAVKVHAEGPYGHETNYFLRYKNLILVAGGAGVTPFLAIMTDLLKRHQLQQDNLPTNVQLIWCVRRRTELATLRTIRPNHIHPNYAYPEANKLTLNVKAYVTGQAKTAGQAELPMVEMPGLETTQKGVETYRGMSVINSYHNLWMIALICASMTGFVLMSGLFYTYVSAQRLQPKGHHFSTAVESILYFISLFVGIVICGGTVIFFWISSLSESGSGASAIANGHGQDIEENDDVTLLDNCIITEGSRPQFQDIFKEVAEKHDGEDVGVLVCGPESLQESVAAACRSRNFGNLMRTPFHYHSVSFDL
ncbi:ferric reduction oxidase 6 [Physcomitrium patens]|uniref:FAD-binding FR-type domain-containing protein n=1 Tax=Physcomitrium patens TaxID=3218 RepID=A0A2K1IAC8_PHYPA|nr:ferric reduction oxidase 6-like [Physcomitrium patens]PNR26229.1 hypothetical protein PHYPA_030803 [Physcomitrium patens]|eukprot:XP_024367800.1 ferric reduction oxidase 6-like [Physcomitrella patens]